MELGGILDWMRHRKATPNIALRLEPEADQPAISAPGYFQLRLSEMRLTDDRRWGREIVPAAFVTTEFNYGREQSRRPYFVSNGLLSSLPQGIDGGRLRIDFRDTLVLGPTPYAGGDVALFVGLFQMAIDDRLKAAFSILEKLFGAVMPGPMTAQIRLASQLAGEISSCLGDDKLKCMLADQSVIGRQAIPKAGYHVYLKGDEQPFEREGLTVREGSLMRRVGTGLQPVTERDYCLVKVEHQALRNDYANLPFHAVFEEARQKLVFGKQDEARLLLLECIGLIYASCDLSEDDKVHLIAFYQAKLLAVQTVRSGAGGGGGWANGQASPVTRMQTRAFESRPLDGDRLADSLDLIRDLHAQFAAAAPAADTPVTGDDVQAFMRSAALSRADRPSAETLVTAVAAGSIAA